MVRTYEPEACPACSLPVAARCKCTYLQRALAVARRAEGTGRVAARGRRKRRKASSR
jgi:hypothetical protein